MSFGIVPNLDLWPVLGQDEAQIVEFGRTVIDPGSDWGTNWMVSEAKPYLNTFYLGSVVQELAYRATAPSILGSRLSSFLGALAAASALLFWLSVRSSRPWVAMLVSLAFLLDPIFTESYRQGRVDSWATAAVFLSCALLAVSRRRLDTEQAARAPLFLSGFLAGLAPSLWPTALALLPLVALELSYLLFGKARAPGRRHASVVAHVLVFAGGSLSGLLLVLTPMLPNADQFIVSYFVGVQVQKTAANIQRSIVDIFVLYDPMILPVLVLSILSRRNIGVIVSLLIALVMIHQTMIYPMRVLYLLPFCFLMIANLFQSPAVALRFSRLEKIAAPLLVILVMWNSYTSLVKHPLVAHSQRDARDPSVVVNTLEREIGKGEFTVFLTEWELYFAARSLGWKPYRVFGSLDKDGDEFRTFLSGMDYVFLRDEYLFAKEVSPKILAEAGFSLYKTISFPSPARTIVEFGPLAIQAPESVYRPVLVFKK